MSFSLRTVATLLLLLPLLTGSSAPQNAVDGSLIQFELKDQFDRPHFDHELRGQNVLILCGDRKGSRYQGTWANALRDSLRSRNHLDSIEVVEVADVRGVPFFVKESVKSKFPKERDSWVLMDWKGLFAKAYDFQGDKCNIVLFDRSGARRYQVAVAELSLPVLEELLDHVGRVSANVEDSAPLPQRPGSREQKNNSHR